MAGVDVRQMAAAPLPEKPAKVKTAILALLGEPVFMPGDGKTYPRQTGWGANKKPHPDGGTNETVAFVVFRPFKGLGLALEGRIYCERFTENGKAKRVYSISLPFLKPERRDGDSNRAIEATKLAIRAAYREWQSDPTTKDAIVKQAATSDKWEETDEPTQ